MTIKLNHAITLSLQLDVVFYVKLDETGTIPW